MPSWIRTPRPSFSAAIIVALATALPLRSEVDFSRDIKPILSENCFTCHGPDEGTREGGLRLDLRDAALRPAKSGEFAIVPGKPDESALLLRVTDEFDAMPPEETGKRLKSEEVARLREWIAAGAPYAPHWSFVPPAPVSPPGVDAEANDGTALHPIDRFVRARLVQEGMIPNPPADRAMLLRRVSFDLTGLPPTPAEVDAFLADREPGAFDRVVDRLLASPRFGERMAVDWLDAARYADSNGMFRDNTRQIWPWRDWVVQAFNRNLPYDRFVVEQLAGDLLPEPTAGQRIATGFNRNHMVSGETGIIDEEYRVEYVADRLETTATVFMGLTVGCARCHDHKYDPISQRDYYRLFAFFNSGVEKGMISPDDPPPVMDVATPEQRQELEELVRRHHAAETEFAAATANLGPALAAWERRATEELRLPEIGLLAHVPFEPEEAESAAAGPLPRVLEKGSVYREDGVVGRAAVFDGMQHLELPADLPLAADRAWSVGLWVKATGSLSCLLAKIEPEGERRGFELIWQKGQLHVNLVDRWVVSAIEVSTREPVKRSDWNHVIVSYDGSRRAAGLRVFIDGLERPLSVGRDSLRGDIANGEPVRIGRRDSGLGFYGQLDELRILDRVVAPDEARTWYWRERLHATLGAGSAKRTPAEAKRVLDCYVERHGDPASRAAAAQVFAARSAEERFRAALPKTLVMQEVDHPRPTHLLQRGQYDAPGEVVSAGVPEWLSPFPVDAPANRLGLAQWLVAPENPLTARVAVNRLWQQCFGEGLVATANDFGAQGALPTHPDLLDWLAGEFVRSGWDLKRMLRLIVTSGTYQQSSVATPELAARDPENTLLARGSRFRLPGEMIRDQAFAVSGLLVERLGGPPVKPYQPPGLWEAVSYNGELTYVPDDDDGLWRRTLYTYWKRTSPPPGVQVFDGPTRETCVVQRPRTNTPLQALLLLNDDTFVEAARALADSVLATGAEDAGRMVRLFRQATARLPDAEEAAILKRLLEQQRARFRRDPAAAQRLLAVGMSERGRRGDLVEMAAWTLVAQAVLNLDEVVMRR